MSGYSSHPKLTKFEFDVARHTASKWANQSPDIVHPRSRQTIQRHWRSFARGPFANLFELASSAVQRRQANEDSRRWRVVSNQLISLEISPELTWDRVAEPCKIVL